LAAVRWSRLSITITDGDVVAAAAAAAAADVIAVHISILDTPHHQFLSAQRQYAIATCSGSEIVKAVTVHSAVNESNKLDR